MTDRELLEECLEAFVAVKVSDHARKVLKKLHKKNPSFFPNGGDQRHVLANYYADVLRNHLWVDK